MRYRINHVTTYDYSESVSISHNEARLVPRATTYQRPLGARLSVEPTATVMVEDVDYFGNVAHFFILQEAHVRLSVKATSEVELLPFEPPALALSMAWEQVREHVQSDRSLEGLRALEFGMDSPQIQKATPGLVEYAAQSFTPRRPVLEAVFDLTRRIQADFAYIPGSTNVSTPLSTVLATRQGVCQDFAHLEIGMLRAFGIPACYVSGYIQTVPAPGQPKLEGADATHAWVSAYCPGFGYVDFDPTNGCIPRDEHITLARGRDFSDASPLRGVILGGGDHVVRVGVDVVRV